MGKKLIISESEINTIRGMYGLVNEQSSSFSIPQSAIKAISDIESVFSYMSGGKIVGKKYSGDEMVGVMKNYVKDTIGFDCWNNMFDLMKAQIYSFCFQSDTSIPYKMKFIAGLANAIDPSISRGDVVGKPLKDPNVQNAINVIKKNCTFIDYHYYDYMRVMDNQYSSMDYNDNYKNIWKYRPTAITRLMNGESWDKVKEDWKLSLTDKVITPQSKSTEKTISEPEVKEPTTPSKIDVVDPNNKPISNSEADDIRRKILSLNYNKETTPTSKGSVELTPTTPTKTVDKVDVKVNKPEVKSVIKRAKRGVLSPDEEL
jgi:hypothetical protein